MAESCTGGKLAAALTSIPGASKWFDSGIVSYSNEAKINLLGVQAGSINKYGAVSEQVAFEMATSTSFKSNYNKLVVAITGIAGPHGGTAAKPIGTVCFACVAYNYQKLETALFNNPFNNAKLNRNTIRSRAVLHALNMLLSALNNI